MIPGLGICRQKLNLYTLIFAPFVMSTSRARRRGVYHETPETKLRKEFLKVLSGTCVRFLTQAARMLSYNGSLAV
jgi:hypothetical protein